MFVQLNLKPLDFVVRVSKRPSQFGSLVVVDGLEGRGSRSLTKANVVERLRSRKTVGATMFVGLLYFSFDEERLFEIEE